MPAADEHEPAVLRPAASSAAASRGDVGDERLGRELDHPGRGAQHLGQPRLQRAEVDAVRVRLQTSSESPSGSRRSLAVGAGAEHDVEQALGPAPRRERRDQLVGSRP